MFLNVEHKQRFEELIDRADVKNGDYERGALFYILSGNSDLYCQINKLYDFDNNWIITGHEADLTGSTEKLVALAHNLCNGTKIEYSFLDTFSSLDDNNFKLAINAIRVRFNK